MQKSYTQKTAEVTRDWHIVDADDKILGRVAVIIAQKLIGKHKPTYTPNIEAGDFVVVINAEKVAVTGDKETKKVYYRHSNFPGGLNSQTLGEMRAKNPTQIIEEAVYNMLPKNKLRSDRMNRLKVYAGSEHPHETHFAASKKSEVEKTEVRS